MATLEHEESKPFEYKDNHRDTGRRTRPIESGDYGTSTRQDHIWQGRSAETASVSSGPETYRPRHEEALGRTEEEGGVTLILFTASAPNALRGAILQ